MNSIIQWLWQLGGRTRAGTPDDNPPPPKRPPLAPGEQALLTSAREWLDAATRAHARIFALGEERTYNVDQDARRLTLHHADGLKVNLADIQILGSFRPQDSSLRWSWANSSVTEQLTAAARHSRDHAATAALVSLRTPTFEVKFEDCVGLVALAARLGGYDCVYRSIVDGSLSVFVAYRLPGLAADVFPPRLTPGVEAEAVAILDRYDAEMLPIDELHIGRPRGMPVEEETKFDHKLLDQKLAIYRRYWTRADQFWEPASFSDPSEHSPLRRIRRFSLPRRAGGIYVITQRQFWHNEAHVLTLIDGKLRITDMDLDWGHGVLLVGPPKGS